MPHGWNNKINKVEFNVLNHHITLERHENGSTITTDLKVKFDEFKRGDEARSDNDYNMAVDGFESLLLALFDAGALETTRSTHTAVTAALEAISNNT